MSQRVQYLLDDLSSGSLSSQPSAHVEGWFRDATPTEVDQLLEALAERTLPLGNPSVEAKLGLLLAALTQWQLALPPSGPGVETANVDRIAAIYRDLGEKSAIRHHLLCLLAAASGPRELSKLVDLLVEDPPTDSTWAALPLMTILRRPHDRLGQLFPRLLRALGHSAVAAPILDLANYVTREKIVDRHPALPRHAQLLGLLSRLVDELEIIEENQAKGGQSPAEMRQKVSDGVSLVVSLCDAMALIGDPSAAGKLRRAMQLQHRRLQVEAASALARLNVEEGVQRLIELAGEPVVRLRVLAYAEELDLLPRVDSRYTTPVARAEAELVSWLAQPTAMGIPPGECDLFDCRQQLWPGFEDPVWCYLFRYTYDPPMGNYCNVGIVGPAVFSFTADLTDLPPDDIYAAYAGWQVEHEDIYESDVCRLTDLQRVDVARLERRLRDAGYDQIVSIRLGSFLGEKALVAAARYQGTRGTAVVDADQVHWCPAAATRRPIGPDEAHCIYKGRKLLRAFNP